MSTAICTATERGRALGLHLAEALGDCAVHGVNDDVFDGYDQIVYICAVGIAVRKIAPRIQSKLTDPAVVVCDEGGKWAVSLLSGHIGGANELAAKVAEAIGATAVITTASDVLAFPTEPRNVVVGVGCRKGATAEQIERAVTIALAKHAISTRRVRALASIDVKQDERGLLRFAALYNLPITFYTAAQLAAAPGAFPSSDFVKATVGVGNVCERAAALRAAGGGLVVPKTAYGNVTIAAYEATL